MHHKRGRPRNARAGCKLCKAWKVSGYSKEAKDAEQYSAHRRRIAAKQEIIEALGGQGGEQSSHTSPYQPAEIPSGMEAAILSLPALGKEC